MTRKKFLGTAASSTVLLFLQACGGGGDDAGTTPSPAPPAPAPSPSAPVPAPPPPAPAPAPSGPTVSQCGSSDAAISGNHGHSLVIPAADLDSTVSMTYDIQGVATHNHTVTFTPAQLQMLKAGQQVTVTSTTTLEHNHNVTVSCA